jgi:hypothetical protein
MYGAVGELMSLNGYAYANGNPVNLVDHTGMIGERDTALLRRWVSCSDLAVNFVVQQPPYEFPCTSGIGIPSHPHLTGITYCNYPEVAWMAYKISGPAITQVEAEAITPSSQGNLPVHGPIAYPSSCQNDTCYGFATATALPPDGIIVGLNVCSSAIDYPVVGFMGCAPNQLAAEVIGFAWYALTNSLPPSTGGFSPN